MASRTTIGSAASRRRSPSSARSSATAAATSRAPTTSCATASWCRADPRLEGPPLMVGSEGERDAGHHAAPRQAWNAWFSWFGNTVEGYRQLRARIDDACRRAGREPAIVERTMALFVAFPDAVGSHRWATAPPRTWRRCPAQPDGLADALRASRPRELATCSWCSTRSRPTASAAWPPSLDAARRLTAAILGPMDEPGAALPLGASGRLEAVPMTNAAGDHALLVRQGDATRALLTGERGEERERVVVIPLDEDVDMRVDGDALAVWLARGSVAPVPTRRARLGQRHRLRPGPGAHRLRGARQPHLLRLVH